MNTKEVCFVPVTKTALTPQKPTFPFSAIVGQSDMKLALLIAATDPSIGGVMVFGDRGTGKSTIVRGLAALLPPIQMVEGCAYNCDPKSTKSTCVGACALRVSGVAVERPTPVIDLPLGATEDRVVGALDLEHALSQGEKRFEPGLLARANRGFLYIDEVNLLEDHLVDLLLDVAASGENLVEREGLSVRHPARFVLIGSGNPEEGELRPQLLDRFGLSVDVKSPDTLADRIEVVKRRNAFDRNPAGFLKAQAAAETDVRNQIIAAREALGAVKAPDSAIEWAAKLCMRVGVDGLRGELTMIRAARAAAALAGDKAIKDKHLRAIAVMSLRHRLRRDPLDETGSTARIERAISDLFTQA
jgi:magnesium chelatase subunit I